MKKFFFVMFFFIIIVLLFIIIKIDYVRRIDFAGKESVKKSFFYIKKNYLVKKYSSCFIDKKNQKIAKQIIIAGHTYGYPDGENLSTYPKFLNHLTETMVEKYDFIFLAGDIVNKSNKIYFLQVKKELNNFFNELYVAPGNHDVGLALTNKTGRNEFLSVFNKNYQETVINDNLFIVLDSTFEPGNISQDQLNFLKTKLKKVKDIKNIFIITHHVIWQNYIGKKVTSNVNKDFFSKSNFGDVISLFKNLENKIKIFFVAGDIGVLKEKTIIFCERKNNLYFIATGMGNKRLDNYLKILVSPEGEILLIKPIFF